MVRSADFQGVLAAAPRSRTAHFSAHYLSACPSLPKKPAEKTRLPKLSTADEPTCPQPVDDGSIKPSASAVPGPPQGHWLGLVVPKRHAKRAVTRNLLKRQMRQLMQAQAHSLLPGLWVLRLKAPFDRQRFASPASDALRQAAGNELALLLQRAAAPR